MKNSIIYILIILSYVTSCHAGIFSGVACTLCLGAYWATVAYTAGAAGSVAGGIGVAGSATMSGTAAAAGGAAGGAVALAAALGPCAGVCTAAINPLI
jgi:hypothetical protein